MDREGYFLKIALKLVPCGALFYEGFIMAEGIMKFFEYQHLPENLQKISKPIGDLAKQMDEVLPSSAEKSAGLRKLLEAKDCLVRANL